MLVPDFFLILSLFLPMLYIGRSVLRVQVRGARRHLRAATAEHGLVLIQLLLVLLHQLLVLQKESLPLLHRFLVIDAQTT